MRISDWSSDVCSSDLLQGMPRRPVGLIGAGPVGLVVLLPGAPRRPAFRRDGVARVMQPAVPFRRHEARLDLALADPPALLPAQRFPVRQPAATGVVVAVALPVAPDLSLAPPGATKSTAGNRTSG